MPANNNKYMKPTKTKPKKPKKTSGNMPSAISVGGVKKQLRMPRYIMVNGVRTKLY